MWFQKVPQNQMDEAAFARELNKYRIVRRPDYVSKKGAEPNKKASLASQSSSTTSRSSGKPQSATKSASVSSSSVDFWDLLQQYCVEKGLPAKDAKTLVMEAKRIHELKMETKSQAVE